MVHEINPITINELMEFVNNSLIAFEDALLLSFTLMITFALAMGIRRIFVGVKQ